MQKNVEEGRIKVVIVGSGTAGKTSFVNRLINDTFESNYDATVFDNFNHTLQLTPSQSVKLEIWDTSGQDSYDRLRHLAYDKVDVALLAFNVADKLSLTLIEEKWYPEIRKYCDTDGKPATMMMVGLKSDLRTELPSIIVQDAAVKSLVKRYGCPYMECSAMHGVGVREVMVKAIGLATGSSGEKLDGKSRSRTYLKRCTIS